MNKKLDQVVFLDMDTSISQKEIESFLASSKFKKILILIFLKKTLNIQIWSSKVWENKHKT